MISLLGTVLVNVGRVFIEQICSVYVENADFKVV